MAALETSFRVFYFDPQLVGSFRKMRDREGMINRDFVTKACDNDVSQLAKELKSIGITGRGEVVPIRLEMPPVTLAALADLSETTGVPATQLLSICLGRASRKNSRKKILAPLVFSGAATNLAASGD
ncbi:MAG: hypothetical protein ACYC6N_18515 [Pirellulaceae bacterium]